MTRKTPVVVARAIIGHASTLAAHTDRPDLAMKVIGLTSQLAGEATLEDAEARWPGRAGDGVPVSGGPTSDPTGTRAQRVDWVNQKRADAITSALCSALTMLAAARNGQATFALTRTLTILRDVKGKPKQMAADIPRCGVHGCDDIARHRTPIGRRPDRKNRCGACYEWERANGQERTSR